MEGLLQFKNIGGGGGGGVNKDNRHFHCLYTEKQSLALVKL